MKQNGDSITSKKDTISAQGELVVDNQSTMQEVIQNSEQQDAQHLII